MADDDFTFEDILTAIGDAVDARFSQIEERLKIGGPAPENEPPKPPENEPPKPNDQPPPPQPKPQDQPPSNVHWSQRPLSELFGSKQ